MTNVVPMRLPGESKGPGDPEDPMLEQRVARLEEELRSLAKDQQKEFTDIKVKLAGIEGRLSAAPTILQLITVVVTTWSAGAAIVFALLRFSPK